MSTESDSSSQPQHRKRRRLVLVGVAVVVVVVLGFLYWLHARNYASTDDAFIDGYSVRISPRVSGQITAVKVQNNELVHDGDVLFKLDQSDFKARVQSARANLDAALASKQAASAGLDLTQLTSSAEEGQASSALTAARSAVDQARAEAQAAHAISKKSQADLTRFEYLYKKGETSHRQLQQIKAAAQSSKAKWKAARHRVKSARAQVKKAKASLKKAKSAPQQVAVKRAQLQKAKAAVEQARSGLHTARLNLSYTVIRASHTGYITKKKVVPGDLVQAGQVLASLVYGTPWVKGNFKETDLARMRPGQSVAISVDAYPDLDLEGHVQSIQHGTGSHFSLLPPENATGNFVKVVQRVPVKIVFDNLPKDGDILSPGLSVVPTVDLTSGKTASEDDGKQ